MNKYGALGLVIWACGMVLGLLLKQSILFLVGWVLQCLLLTAGMIVEDIKNATR